MRRSSEWSRESLVSQGSQSIRRKTCSPWPALKVCVLSRIVSHRNIRPHMHGLTRAIQSTWRLPSTRKFPSLRTPSRERYAPMARSHSSSGMSIRIAIDSFYQCLEYAASFCAGRCAVCIYVSSRRLDSLIISLVLDIRPTRRPHHIPCCARGLHLQRVRNFPTTRYEWPGRAAQIRGHAARLHGETRS